MSKHKGPEELLQINIKLPASLVRKIRIVLMDPVKGRVKYGALSSLGAKLFGNWLNKLKRENSNKLKKENIDGT